MNKKIKTALLILVLPLLCAAQNVITGTVEDESTGLPIPSCDVTVSGTSHSTRTDFDGNYTLKNVPYGAVIYFSYLGYTTQEVAYTGQNTINVILAEEPSLLERSVLIAHGSVKQENLTGAHKTIIAKEFNKGAITNLGAFIAGKIAGVQVTAATGRPSDGAVIRVRPGATLSGNQNALYVVDGMPLDQNNARLNSINPNDIESITILKDASVTAIYGNRASNGVILITTKKANFSSDLKVRYDVLFAVEKVDNYIDVLTGDEFRQLVADQGRDTSILGDANTDWQDAIYQNGKRAIHNLTVEKGYDNTSIRASLGYNNEHGILQRSGYERGSLSLNVIQKLLDNKLKLTFTSQLAKEEIRSADGGAVGAAVVFDPTQPIRTGNNEFGGFFEYTNSTGSEPNAPRNPLGLLNSLDAQLDNSQARLNMNAEYKLPVDGLKFTGNTGIDYNEFDSYLLRDPNSGAGARVASQNFSRGIRRNNLLDGRLDYKKELENLNTTMDLTLGSSVQTFFRQSFNRGLENGTLTDFSSSSDENSITAFFGRARFDIKDIVVLTGSYSRNGSSRFSAKNRWSNFYGISSALKFTNTEFIKNSVLLSQFTIRGGFGQTGQQEIHTPFTFFSSFTANPSMASITFGNEFLTTPRPEDSRDLVWETTNQWNLGIDLGIFNDRLTGSVDGFYRETSDLLLFNPNQASSLENGLFQNGGSLLSRGIETSIFLKVIEKENISWNIGANITFQEIEITDLAGANDDPVQVGGISGGVGNNIQEWAVGSDPTSFYVFRQVYDQNGKPLDGVYQDINGDNVINDADRVGYKKANHDSYFGLTTNFSYKRFDLSATLRGATGGYNYNNVTSNAANLASIFPTNTQNLLYNNTPVDFNNTEFSNQELFSDYYIQRADFIKLDNVSLGYNIPGDKVDIRASITGTNLLTITDYDGVDPEVFGGIDNNLFPRTRGIIFGLGFKF